MATETYIPLATTTLASSASSVTFSSIDQSYGDLILIVVPSNAMQGYLRFNADSGSNYSFVYMRGTGSSAQSSAGSGSFELIDTGANELGKVEIMDYSATDKHKSTLNRSSRDRVVAKAGRWANTSAITSISVTGATGDFSAGSTFSLYGIAK